MRTPLAVQRATFLAELQAKVSAAIVQLLGADPTLEKIAPRPPSPRDAARAKGLLRYRGEPCDVHGDDVERSTATGRCVQSVTERNMRQAPNRKAWHKATRRRAARDLAGTSCPRD
jgi:hypothetical protein